MKQSKSLPLISGALFTSLLPLILSGAFYALTSIIVGLKPFLSTTSNSNYFPYLEKIEILFEQIRTVSLSAYDSYFQFMIVMGIINLIWEVLTSPRTIGNQGNSQSSKHHLQGFTAKFALFSLIYLLIFTFQSDLLRSSHLFHSKPNGTIQELSHYSRILEQQQEVIPSTAQILTPEKLSLSIGRILGSLDLDLASFVLSKDNKYVFALGRKSWVLTVVDISDLKDPLVKSSLEFDIEFWYFGQKNLILSPDGNTLYMSDFKYLQIVNVTDPLLPNAIGFCQEKSLPDLPGVYSSSKGHPLTTLALTKDSKTLFIGGFGLQIFDVSSTPQALFKNIHNCNDNKCMNITTVALSDDGQNLFLANGTLNIYQISTENLPHFVSSYESQSLVTSVFLFDEKTAYIAGTYNRSKVTIEKIDISDIQAPKRLNFRPLPLLQDSFRPAYIAANSPNKTQLYILVEINTYDYFSGPDVLVYDITKDLLINDNQSLLKNAFSIIISADGKKVFASSNSRFKVLELFLDYPNRRIMSLSQNPIDYFNTGSFWEKVIPSLDNQILFVIAQNPDVKESCFEIWNLAINSSPALIASYEPLAAINFMAATADYTKALFHTVDNKLTVLDITNLTNPTPFSNSYTFDDDVHPQNLQLSKNSHRVFVNIQTGLETNNSLVLLDFSDPNSIKQVSIIQALRTPQGITCEILFDKEEKIVFLIHRFIEIYDYSDPSNPTFLNSFPIAINESYINLYSACLSPDSKTLFTEFYEANYYRKLRIFNLTELTFVTLISDTILPMYDVGYLTRFQITPDAKTGYVFQREALLILSLTDLAAPSISGVIPLRNSSFTGWAANVFFSFDRKTAFVSGNQGIMVLDLQLTILLRHSLWKKKISENYSLSFCPAVLRISPQKYHRDH